MGTNNSFKTSLMFTCFGSALVLFVFSAARPAPAPKPAPKPVTHKSQIKQVSPLIPVLTKAIASVSSRVVVDLSKAQVYLYWGGRLLSRYPVAVGQQGWETPTGTFKVLQKLRNPVWQQPITGDLIPAGPNNPLGNRWIGFWSDGRHRIGFHGTNKENLVGKPVSHGCLRMRNSDIQALYAQVSVGTPVIVRQGNKEQGKGKGP